MKLFVLLLRTQAAEAIITSDTSQADRCLRSVDDCKVAKWFLWQARDRLNRAVSDFQVLLKLSASRILCVFWECGRWLVHQEQIWRRSYVVMVGGENHNYFCFLRFKPVRPGIAMASLVLDAEVLPPGCCGVWQGSFGTPVRKEMQFNRHVFGA